MKKINILMVLIVMGFMFSTSVSNAEAKSNEEDYFTIVVLPDTQFYSNYECRKGVDLKEIGYCKWLNVKKTTYERQTQWIKEKKDELNIKYVVHLGDITDQNTKHEWKTASKAHITLDHANIPYTIVQGNHDYNEHYKGAKGLKRNSKFDNYFMPERFKNDFDKKNPFYDPDKGNEYCDRYKGSEFYMEKDEKRGKNRVRGENSAKYFEV